MIDCSKKIKRLREARGMTQQEVANYVGISKSMVSAYETSTKTPSLEVLVWLSRLFGVSVDYLLFVDAPKTIDVSALDDESVALLTALIGRMSPQQSSS